MWKNPSRSLSLSKSWGCLRKILRPGKIKPWELAGAVRRRFLTSLIGRRKHQSKMENGIQQLFINYSLKNISKSCLFLCKMPVIKTFVFSYANLGYVWHKTEHKASFYFNGPNGIKTGIPLWHLTQFDLYYPPFRPFRSIGNSMISSDIWHKYHEWKLLYVIWRAFRDQS